MKKLIKYLNTLDTSELDQLEHFLHDPFLKGKIGDKWPGIKVVEGLSKVLIPEFRLQLQSLSSKLSGSDLLEKLYPGMILSNSKLRKIGSQMLFLVKAYWIQKAALRRGSSISRETLLLEELWRRQLLTERELPKLREGSLKYATSEMIENDLQVSEIILKYSISKMRVMKPSQVRETVTIVSDALYKLKFLNDLRSLRLQCVLANQSRYLGDEVLQPTPAIETNSGVKGLEGIADLYRLTLRILTESEDLDQEDLMTWKEIVDVIRHSDFPVHSEEGREIVRYLINAGCRIMASLPLFPSIAEAIFDLYLFALHQGILLVEGALPGQHYLNVGILAIQIQQIDFARDFSLEYREKLSREARKDNAFARNMTMVMMAKESWEEALAYLSDYHPADLGKLGKYVLEIKILWEIDQERMIHKIDSYTMWLRRHVGIIEPKRQEQELHRARLIRNLAMVERHNQAKILNLREQAKELRFDWYWFFKKTEALLKN